MKDPRPDLKSDSKLWSRLFQLAYEIDPGLCGILNGFRCEGTRLKKGQVGYVLRPDIDPSGDSAWASEEQYKAMRNKWLQPHQDKIIKLLGLLKKED